jgi:ParB-like chromosome segregation protein Spo0J
MSILVPIISLYPHEEVDENIIQDLYNLKQKDILPIVVDQFTNVILDGHHRWTVFKLLERTHIPVFYVDYMSSNILILTENNKRKITKKEVINAALTNELFSSKTTHHMLYKNGRLVTLNEALV